ncbi:hypothetical protein YC2023_035505 [Brassica napus]
MEYDTCSHNLSNFDFIPKKCWIFNNGKASLRTESEVFVNRISRSTICQTTNGSGTLLKRRETKPSESIFLLSKEFNFIDVVGIDYQGMLEFH